MVLLYRISTALDVGGESDRKRSRIPYRSKIFNVKISFKDKFSMDSIVKAANREPLDLSSLPGCISGFRHHTKAAFSRKVNSN